MFAEGPSQKEKCHELTKRFILFSMMQTLCFLFLKPFGNTFRISGENYQNDPHANTDRLS